MTERKQVKAAIDKAVAEFGSLDVMFNNAGLNKPMNFLDVTEDNWNLIMKVNGLGVLIGMQEAAKQMIKQGKGGKIINTASVAGRQGYDNIAPYCASKFSVVSLTQSGARALAKNNITVNGFAPGVVNTPLWEQLDKDLMELGASQRPGQAIAEFSAGILRGRAAAAEGHHRDDDVPGRAGLRLHDRPDHHDRRWNGARLAGGKTVSVEEPKNSCAKAGCFGINSGRNDHARDCERRLAAASRTGYRRGGGHCRHCGHRPAGRLRHGHGTDRRLHAAGHR